MHQIKSTANCWQINYKNIKIPHILYHSMKSSHVAPTQIEEKIKLQTTTITTIKPNSN